MPLVRDSIYRHVFIEPVKEKYFYENLKVKVHASDSDAIAANALYAAFPGSSKGTISINKHENFGSSIVPTAKISGKRVDFLDMEFHRFNQSLLATGDSDAVVKIWSVPSEMEKESGNVISEPVQELVGHGKKICRVRFHPTAENVLLSTGFDKSFCLWDIEKGDPQLHFEDKLTGPPQDVSFNMDGSLFVCSCRDKIMRIFDAHTGECVQQGKAYSGSKPSRTVWLKRLNLIATTGFQGSYRVIKLWDPTDFSNPLDEHELDTESGIMIPVYDEDTGILTLSGKGSTQIKIFEVDGKKKKFFEISTYLSKESQKGICRLPKLTNDTELCEIIRLYKLTTDKIIPLRVRVPRKSTAFHRDVYSDTFGPEPSISADEFFGGQNAAPKEVSMKPGEKPELGFDVSAFKPVKATPKAKPAKTTASPSGDDSKLKAENEALKKENAALKEENTALKKENEELTGTNSSLKSTVASLKEEIQHLTLQIEAQQEEEVQEEEADEPAEEAEAPVEEEEAQEEEAQE